MDLFTCKCSYILQLTDRVTGKNQKGEKTMGIITAHSGCDGTEDNSLEFVTYALRSEAGCRKSMSGRDRMEI